jgi:hypothetical protein
LTRWLANRAWVSAERPSVLFDLATARLAERKILLPGVTVLARLEALVRDQAASRLWRTLAPALKPCQAARLETLLVADESSRQSRWSGSAAPRRGSASQAWSRHLSDSGRSEPSE